MGEKEIKDEVLEDLEPENGDEVKGGSLIDEVRKPYNRARKALRDEGIELDRQ